MREDSDDVDILSCMYKEHIMKEKRVEYLAIMRGDLSYLKDEVGNLC